MAAAVCSFACYPDNHRSLEFLKPALSNMFFLFDRYLDKWDHPGGWDRPYAYNERATLSLFAGGIWRSNSDNMVMEEYCDKKQGEAGEYRGRYDIWFEAEGQRCFGEAKQTPPPAADRFDEAKADSIIATLQAETDSAYANVCAGATALTPRHAIGIVFLVPYLTWRHQGDGAKHFQNFSDVMAHRLKEFASGGRYSVLRGSYFRPDLLADDRLIQLPSGSKQAYPGVDALICEKRDA